MPKMRLNEPPTGIPKCLKIFHRVSENCGENWGVATTSEAERRLNEPLHMQLNLIDMISGDDFRLLSKINVVVRCLQSRTPSSLHNIIIMVSVQYFGSTLPHM